MHKSIRIRGAREHNLKNVDLEIPRDRLVVITGLSGSGKSSMSWCSSPSIRPIDELSDRLEGHHVSGSRHTFDNLE